MTSNPQNIDYLFEKIVNRNPGEPEFHQALQDVLETLAP